MLAASPGLASEAIGESLVARGMEVLNAPIPSGPRELREVGRSVAAARGSLGMVVSDLVDAQEIQGVYAILSGLPLRWLVVTSEPAGPLWGAMLEAGAVAVLPMSGSLDGLRRSLLGLATGHEVVSPDLLSRVLREWHRARDTERDLAARLQSLTPREMAVLDNLSAGLPVKAIAEQVGVSEGTVRSQVKSILRKLGVRSQLAGVAAYREFEDLRRRRRRAPRPTRWL